MHENQITKEPKVTLFSALPFPFFIRAQIYQPHVYQQQLELSSEK